MSYNIEIQFLLCKTSIEESNNEKFRLSVKHPHSTTPIFLKTIFVTQIHSVDK